MGLRLQSAILSDFANEGFPFNSGHKTGYYFREFGEMKITYKLKAFTAFIDYKGVNATLDCKLTAESIRALETLMPLWVERYRSFRSRNPIPLVFYC